MVRGKCLADLKLSRLMLGTVQFGLDYGIANKSGRPDYQTVREIIACAYEAGVNCLDTAPGYGKSEEIIGRVLTELGIKDRVIVVSKVPCLAETYSSEQKAAEVIEESITGSLKRLKLEQLPVCLFHAEKNWRYIELLLKMRSKGLVRHVGSSVMTPAATREILDSGQAEALQIPLNVFDRRFLDSGICRDAGKNKVAVFARSVYLQGLVVLPEEEFLPELAPVIPVRRKLKLLADESGMTLAELALRYVLGIGGLTCILLGVDTVAQIRQNLALFAKGALADDLCAAIADSVPLLPDTVLMPTKWSKRMPDAVPEKR